MDPYVLPMSSMSCCWPLCWDPYVVKLDSLRAGRVAGRVADEVIQHLTKLVGANVEVTLEIQVRLQDGASDKTVRDVTENCRTLRFDTFGFEEK